MVIGGGRAGMAASIHLARAGLQVLYIEADPQVNDPIAESLDWSAPGLLNVLGPSMDHLIHEGISTYKRHVVLKLRGGAEQDYIPGDWLANPPFNVELRTIHVDRTRLNHALREVFTVAGVHLLRDKAIDLKRDGNRIISVKTEGGVEIQSRWFIDASGSGASLFPRLFGLPVFDFRF